MWEQVAARWNYGKESRNFLYSQGSALSALRSYLQNRCCCTICLRESHTKQILSCNRRILLFFFSFGSLRYQNPRETLGCLCKKCQKHNVYWWILQLNLCAMKFSLLLLFFVEKLKRTWTLLKHLLNTAWRHKQRSAGFEHFLFILFSKWVEKRSKKPLRHNDVTLY